MGVLAGMLAQVLAGCLGWETQLASTACQHPEFCQHSLPARNLPEPPWISWKDYVSVLLEERAPKKGDVACVPFIQVFVVLTFIGRILVSLRQVGIWIGCWGMERPISSLWELSLFGGQNSQDELAGENYLPPPRCPNFGRPREGCGRYDFPVCFPGFRYLPQTWGPRARFCSRAVVVDSSVFPGWNCAEGWFSRSLPI